MRSFRFWIGAVTLIILAILGYLLGGWVPLPPPFTTAKTQALYSLIGALISFLVFSRLTSWLIHTSTELFRRLVNRLTSEMINQLTNLSLTRPLGGVWHREEREPKIINPIIVDTSALIDGRLLDVVKTGFLSGVVLIPDFVLRELQQVADSADSLKRIRGRRGFEIVEELKKVSGVNIRVWDRPVGGKIGVDDQLIKLAKALKGKILTVDFNLNRVATISNIKVLNLNELSNALKSLPVPGETLRLKLIHLGKDTTQGVGYLTDGTMVVIKDGAKLLGKEIQVEVTKILQGASGRMVFGKKS